MQIKTGLKRWSKLHLVRTVASIAAFGLAAFSLAASNKAEPVPVVALKERGRADSGRRDKPGSI